MYNKVKELSNKRIKYFIKNKIPFYKWNQTYIDWIKDELQEVEDEIKENNSVYLEDELWDLFWDYLCLLHSLENEWKISSVEKVFERSYEKFSERIWVNWTEWQNWDKIKKAQKQKREKEHNKLFNI